MKTITKAKTTKAKPSSKAIVTVDEDHYAYSETEAVIHAITKASRDPKTDIAKLDWLLKTREKLMESEAEQALNDALSGCQAELEPVRRDASNPQTKSRYASYPALDAAIRPTYLKYRIALSFDTEQLPDPLSVLVVCYVSLGRARRRYSIPMPADGIGPKGNPVMTRTHATGSAVTYGKRYLLGMIFNVVVADRDDDGNAAGRLLNRGGSGQELQGDPLETGELATTSQISALRAIMKRAAVPADLVLETFGIDKLEDLTQHQCNQAVKKCNKKLEIIFAEEKKRQEPVEQDVFPGDRP